MTAKPTTAQIARTIRAAIKSPAPDSPAMIKLAELGETLSAQAKRKTDFSARGQMAWETRRKNAKAAARAAAH